tara:strand:+ start:471 stop:680 length:210 start_codon:yes stop_codon:yes gene_type:complete
MSHDIIRFRIRQDGVVEEKVEGVYGNSCERLTKEIENALGDISRRIHTADYYLKQPNKNVTLQHDQDQN